MSLSTTPLAQNMAKATPVPLAQRMRGLSDRSVAWLFIGPTMVLLLAINIFPLIWTVRLSFTNFRANRPNAEVLGVGLDNYISVLTDPDIWVAMQTTAHFLFWTILLQVLIGFALVDRPQIPRPWFLDHADPDPHDAVARRGGQFLGLLVPAADRLVQLHRGLLQRSGSFVFLDAGLGESGALGHRHRRHLDVDALRHAHLPGRAALDSRLHLRSR
jgi:hypothetical protein